MGDYQLGTNQNKQHQKFPAPVTSEESLELELALCLTGWDRWEQQILPR
jgi:hypothetical protein